MKIFYQLKPTLAFLLVLLLQQSSYSNLKFEFSQNISYCLEIQLNHTEELTSAEIHASSIVLSQKPFSIFRFLKLKQEKNKKLIAAVLAFPFPFGIVGLHRIYLGSAPYIPIVYIGSLGGVFGILPLLDFFAILIEKDLSTYMNNNKVFMWVK